MNKRQPPHVLLHSWIVLLSGALTAGAAPQSSVGSQPGAALVQGIAEYRKGRFTEASGSLERMQRACGVLCDYTAYYLALSLAGARAHHRSAAVLQGFELRFPESPMLPDAVRLRTEYLIHSGRPADAKRSLETSGNRLSAPVRLLLRGRVAEAAGDRRGAQAAYRELYVRYPASPQANEAAAILAPSTGKSPVPLLSAAERLERARSLFDAAMYGEARVEFARVAGRANGSLAERAMIGGAAADFRAGATERACGSLSRLKPADSGNAAERLYYLVECARRQDRPAEIVKRVGELGSRFAGSPWYEDALISAGNYFMLNNATADSQRMFGQLVARFPRGRHAAVAHWKIAWQAYLSRSVQADELLRDHLRRYPNSRHAVAARYWLARLAESSGEAAVARTHYEEIIRNWPLQFYALRAARRLADLPPLPSKAAVRYRPQPLPVRQPVALNPPLAVARRIERARQLRALALPDLADAELRAADPSKAGSQFLGLELAEQAALRGEHHRAMRALKLFAPDYLSYSTDSVPRRFWELMFPMPWKTDLVRAADRHSLSLPVIAALIRQESEFNPGAVSKAGARGLMQIMPSTGTRLARQAGLPGRFRAGDLHTPDLNIRFGVMYLRSLLDDFAGGIESALAGYNAGPSRARKWLGWAQFQDPEEFVETIPFTETREYVLAVLRNAEIYEKLYDLPASAQLRPARLSE